MAVDMTNLTTAQYRQRIEEMSVEEIQKNIEYYEQPGYNVRSLPEFSSGFYSSCSRPNP